MSVKEELHELVDRLGDERASEALAYLRCLLWEGAEDEGLRRPGWPREWDRWRCRDEFFAQPKKDLATLAAEQGVRPVTNFDDLLGDFWPEDETADEFAAAVRQWRREGGDA